MTDLESRIERLESICAAFRIDTLRPQLEALAEDFAWAIRIHPTLSESMVEAGRAILGQALNMPKF